MVDTPALMTAFLPVLGYARAGELVKQFELCNILVQ